MGVVVFAITAGLHYARNVESSGEAKWKILPIVVSAIAIMLFRLIIKKLAEGRCFHRLYRKRPGAANIYCLGMEWAGFALAAGFVLSRYIKLSVATIVNVGRIDKPFLHPASDNLGGMALDPYPSYHLKDIIAQEAHRHPYIEALGRIYLMKLRYKDQFGNRAGSCWRLIFVYALMPWMHKYRVLEEEEGAEISDGDDGDSYDEETGPSKETSRIIALPTFRGNIHHKETIERQQNQIHELQKQIAKLQKQLQKKEAAKNKKTKSKVATKDEDK